jgi:hypothetical protein
MTRCRISALPDDLTTNTGGANAAGCFSREEATMNIYLTVANTELDQLIRQTPPGMMFWSGTCPDPTRTCGQCAHWQALHARRFGCGLYKKHTGVAKPLLKETPACKYFEAKP